MRVWSFPVVGDESGNPDSPSADLRPIQPNGNSPLTSDDLRCLAMRRPTERIALVWRSLDFSSTRSAGHLSSILFVLCGLLVAATSPLMPGGPGVHRNWLIAVGAVATASGFVIERLPWHRWSRSATLWLVPAAFALIAVHNIASGENGLRYNVFFFVVAAWVGLMHPAGTAIRLVPAMAVAYLLPGAVDGRLTPLLSSLTYAVPAFVLVGECASLVAERVRQSESALRSSEERFRALVQNSTDVISVVTEDGTIRYDSPGITSVLGYGTDERVGTSGFDYVHREHLALARSHLLALNGNPGAVRRMELRIRHRDGSWRWCEATVRNLLDDPAVRGLVVNVSDVTERHRAESIQRQLAAIVESSTDAIIGNNLDGTVLSWNRAAEEMFGFPTKEMIGTNIRVIVPRHRRGEMADLLRAVADGDHARVVTQRLHHDGSVLDVSLSMSPVRDSSGAVVAAATIARDITADVRAARALADREASFRLLFAANPQPMWVYDSKTLRFLEVNDAAVRHYGFTREQFLEMDIMAIRPPAAGDRLRSTADEQREHRVGTWQHRLADGRIIDVEVTSHRLEFAGRAAVLVAAQDVTDRNVLEAELRHQAFHDSLTGLSNRALFNDRVEHALGRRSERGSAVVLLLDLDEFKVINDSLGHAVGDDLLVAVARRLEKTVRAADTVSRLGGDEFAVLIEDCTVASAEGQAQRLLDALGEPFLLGSKEVNVTASIGIAQADGDTSTGELMRNADVAMYRAKSTSGGCYRVFEPAMHAAALRQMEVTASLRQAIDEEQFVLYYQPVAALRDGEIVGMEALVRWRHPEHGLVAPAEFIPALEDSGLIVTLGEWILHRACLDAMTTSHSPFRVNVNLSGRQLADPDIVEHVASALETTGLPPHRLMLEITESVLMQGFDNSARRLSELRTLGVGLAIDDFGTGYSSLSYLRTFPVDELKIDKSFIDALPHDDGAVPLLRTIVQLARSLSLLTVAEGVETQEQYSLLQGLGCDQVQGYYISRPRPVDEAVMLTRTSPTWHLPFTTAPRQRDASVDVTSGR